MLVAPTELRHAAFRALARNGRGSNTPEEMGADFCFSWKGQWYLIQRKEMKDFIASVTDGRLARETMQMKATEVGHALLVIEGNPKWGLDGALMGDRFGPGWSRSKHSSQLLSLQQAGWWTLGTSDTSDTANAILDFEKWVKKAAHTSLSKRGPLVSPFGTHSNLDYQRFLIMGLPGVDIILAQRIIDTIGLPFCLRVTAEDLLRVEGLGKKKVAAILNAIEGI